MEIRRCSGLGSCSRARPSPSGRSSNDRRRTRSTPDAIAEDDSSPPMDGEARVAMYAEETNERKRTVNSPLARHKSSSSWSSDHPSHDETRRGSHGDPHGRPPRVRVASGASASHRPARVDGDPIRRRAPIPPPRRPPRVHGWDRDEGHRVQPIRQGRGHVARGPRGSRAHRGRRQRPVPAGSSATRVRAGVPRAAAADLAQGWTQQALRRVRRVFPIAAAFGQGVVRGRRARRDHRRAGEPGRGRRRGRREPGGRRAGGRRRRGRRPGAPPEDLRVRGYNLEVVRTAGGGGEPGAEATGVLGRRGVRVGGARGGCRWGCRGGCRWGSRGGTFHAPGECTAVCVDEKRRRRELEVVGRARPAPHESLAGARRGGTGVGERADVAQPQTGRDPRRRPGLGFY